MLWGDPKLVYIKVQIIPPLYETLLRKVPNENVENIASKSASSIKSNKKIFINGLGTIDHFLKKVDLLCKNIYP